MLSERLGNIISQVYLAETVKKLSFIEARSERMIFAFSNYLKVEIFMKDDIIFKEFDFSSKLFFIKSGFVQALQEKSDFKFYDFLRVREFITD